MQLKQYYYLTESDRQQLKQYIKLNVKPYKTVFAFSIELGMGKHLIYKILSGRITKIALKTHAKLEYIFNTVITENVPITTPKAPKRVKKAPKTVKKVSNTGMTINIQQGFLNKLNQEHFKIELKTCKIYRDINELNYISVKNEHVREVEPVNKKIVEMFQVWQSELNDKELASQDFQSVLRLLLNKLSIHIDWLCNIITKDVIKENGQMLLYKVTPMYF